MFHLAANTILIGQTVDTDVTPLTDSVLLVQNSHFVLQQDMYLFAAYAMSATLSRTRIILPSFRVITTPWIRPIAQATITPNNPNVADYREHPLRIRALEELQIAATSGLAMGTERFTSLLWLGDTVQQAPQGDIYTLRGTSTTAVTANAWSQLTMTWQDTLPAGTYTIVGLGHESANAIAARLIINGQQWRPGALSFNSFANRIPEMFHRGGLGSWGSFRSTAMPIPEALCNAADASHEVYLDFVRSG